MKSDRGELAMLPDIKQDSVSAYATAQYSRLGSRYGLNCVCKHSLGSDFLFGSFPDFLISLSKPGIIMFSMVRSSGPKVGEVKDMGR